MASCRGCGGSGGVGEQYVTFSRAAPSTATNLAVKSMTRCSTSGRRPSPPPPPKSRLQLTVGGEMTMRGALEVPSGAVPMTGKRGTAAAAAWVGPARASLVMLGREGRKHWLEVAAVAGV